MLRLDAQSSREITNKSQESSQVAAFSISLFILIYFRSISTLHVKSAAEYKDNDVSKQQSLFIIINVHFIDYAL
jgi:hypothetical protein